MLFKEGVSTTSFYDYFVSRMEAEKDSTKSFGFSKIAYVAIINEIASDHYLISSNYIELYNEIFSYWNEQCKRPLISSSKKNGFSLTDKNFI
mgnify:CR=1 FL=1